MFDQFFFNCTQNNVFKRCLWSKYTIFEKGARRAKKYFIKIFQKIPKKRFCSTSFFLIAPKIMSLKGSGTTQKIKTNLVDLKNKGKIIKIFQKSAHLAKILDTTPLNIHLTTEYPSKLLLERLSS